MRLSAAAFVFIIAVTGTPSSTPAAAEELALRPPGDLVEQAYLAGVNALERGDHAAAAQAFRTGAEHDDPRALYQLSRLYRHGLGVERSRFTAYRLCARAAIAGHPEAQHERGVMLVKGEGIRANRANGRKWLEQAARQGLADSIHALGVLALNDTVSPPEPAEAYAYFLLAAERGHDVAEVAVRTMAAALNDEQHAAARVHLANLADRYPPRRLSH